MCDAVLQALQWLVGYTRHDSCTLNRIERLFKCIFDITENKNLIRTLWNDISKRM